MSKLSNIISKIADSVGGVAGNEITINFQDYSELVREAQRLRTEGVKSHLVYKEMTDNELQKAHNDIKAEHRRRQLEKLARQGRKVNGAWYYMKDDLKKDSGSVSHFTFVRKEYWDEHGKGENLIDYEKYPILIPPVFYEYVEDCYSVSLSRRKAEKLLEDFGFTKINETIKTN